MEQMNINNGAATNDEGKDDDDDDVDPICCCNVHVMCLLMLVDVHRESKKARHQTVVHIFATY